MSKITEKSRALSVTAYQGDAKTLLAWDLLTELARDKLAGFTVQIRAPGKDPYYLQNNLSFERPGDHAQSAVESTFSSLNAPIHKFRWVHIPGSAHQGLKPVHGLYEYTVTPRYFDDRGSMQPLDPQYGVTVKVEVGPFSKNGLSLGFTRGFTQSQAFVRHFGLKASIRPKDAPLQFDTSQVSGTNAQGEKFTYAQQYEWLGFTARQRIFELLQSALDDKALSVDVFAYDLNEPDVVGLLLRLGSEGRARVLLDNAALHHDPKKPKPEDEFAELFARQAGADRIKRGNFERYAHNKVFIVSRAGKPIKVLTGSTNFSVTGLYVNSNHVLVFDSSEVAAVYNDVFNEAWADGAHAAAFKKSAFGKETYKLGGQGLPPTEITFSPHSEEVAGEVLGRIVKRVQEETQRKSGKPCVLFAVMELDSAAGTKNPVYEALTHVHEGQSIFSYGISDNPGGIALYDVGKAQGVLVTGKPINTKLPPPFDQVPNIGGVGHQVHHKFVVCGFNSEDPVVFCGSSNLALKGEQVNGDNLLMIRDADVAAAFAIEALSLVDHFSFLDKTARGPKAAAAKAEKATGVKQQDAAAAGWFLATNPDWVHKFYDPHDLHYKDRELFAG